MPDRFVREERIRRAFFGTCVCSAIHKITQYNTIQSNTNRIPYDTTQYNTGTTLHYYQKILLQYNVGRNPTQKDAHGGQCIM